MGKTRRNFLLLAGAAGLAGCAKKRVPVLRPDAQTLRPVPRPGGGSADPAPGARTPEALDTTTRDQRAAAIEAAATGGEGRELGRTIASLGDPTRPGFWLETPLVSAPAKGRIVLAAGDVSVAVDLIPIAGAPSGGSRLSLAAMRLLGVALTDLPELIVYAR